MEKENLQKMLLEKDIAFNVMTPSLTNIARAIVSVETEKDCL